MPQFVGHAPPQPLPSGLKHKTRKARLELVVGPDCDDEGWPWSIPIWLKTAVAQVARLLEEHEQYTHLSLSLKVYGSEIVDGMAAAGVANRRAVAAENDDNASVGSSAESRASDGPYDLKAFCKACRRTLLRRLAHLRNRSHVTVEGVVPESKRQLLLMTNNEPAMNLYTMLERLRRGVIGMHDWDIIDVEACGYSLEDMLQECEAACDHGQIDLFFRRRGRLMSLLAMKFLNRMRYMTAGDSDQVPSDWRGPYMAATKDIVKQSTADVTSTLATPEELGLEIERFRLYSEGTVAQPLSPVPHRDYGEW